MADQPVVLVIDDEDSIQKLLNAALERDGYRIVGARDAAEGLIAFEREHPDVILLDVMLPDLSGREVCRRIRATSAVPIIMLSALDEEVDKVVGLELGADDYITKPFGMRELRSRVRAVLRRSQLAAATPESDGERLEVGDVLLDPARRVVTVGAASVDLTYVEVELLQMLMSSPGRVFSRAQLLDGVWGSSDFREPRTVDVHVRHLREKLEPSPSEPRYIQTVRGVGYRFAD
ncbi:MAG: two-component system, OmpR family, response regulator RegX3 [Gaiellaceae bacterium]|nr:two-component system, OmpR family, response regulator RegX3 [Gaiellaceae bacterium]